MSQVKKRSLIFLFLITIVSVFVVGCRNKSVAVKDIYFNLTDGEQIVLLVGQTLDIDEFVEIAPSNATNKGYDVSSFNEDVVIVEGTLLKAFAEGNTKIRIVSHDDHLKEDLMTVAVKATKTTLSTPKNLTYDSFTQMLRFDTVPNASSYTIKINSKEINVGNSNVFDLTKYEGEIFDTLISVQIKANAPSYTYALESSSYCEEFKFYQAGEVSNVKIVDGVLSFEKSNEKLKSNVYLDNETYLKDTDLTSLDFNNMKEVYAGQNVTIRIEEVASDELKTELGEGVVFYNSKAETVTLQVLDIPKVSIKTTKLEWQNIENALKYQLYFGNSLIGETQNNYFELSTWKDFASSVTISKTSEIFVKVVAEENCINIGKTGIDGLIKLKKLQSPKLKCNGPNIEWDEISNASVYSFVLNDNADEQSSTHLTHLSMKGYDAGDYKIKLQAIASELPDENNIFYVSSDASTKTFTKQPMVSAYIEDYKLYIEDLKTDSAKLTFDLETNNREVSGDNTMQTVDLSKMQFDAGANLIRVTRLGNNSTSVDSSDLVIKFVQLEAISEIFIKDAVASVERSDINKNAVIKLSTKGAQLEAPYVVEDDEVAFDTQNHLKAGDYTTEVYIYGDGEKTFSYRENGEIVRTASIEFTVLEAPNLTLNDPAIEKLSISEITNASSYDVFKVEDENVLATRNTKTLEQALFEFDMVANYSVQAIGDGERYLDSKVSLPVTISRLQTPELIYNSSDELLSKKDYDNDGLVEKFELKKDGVVTEVYDYSDGNRLTNDTTFTLQAIAKEGIFYLNSKVFTLNLTKILNDETSIELSADNKLIIKPKDHEDEYNLELVFSFDSISYETIGEVLTNGSIELPYSYDAENKVYEISLIGENHNVRIDELKQEFSVQVKFNKPEDLEKDLINSEYTDFASFNLNIIEEETTIHIDENNNLVITPANHDKEYALILELTYTNESSNTTLQFVSDGNNKLICGNIELPYSYESEKYYVELLEENYTSHISTLLSEFNVKVQYRHHHDSNSDVDSAFSTSYTFSVLPKATVSRNGQSLEVDIRKGYNLENYALIINDDNELLYLDESGVTTDESTQNLLINIDYIYKNRKLNAEAVHAIYVVALNFMDENAQTTLSSKSEPIYIQKAQPVSLEIAKENDSEITNSAIASFEVYDAEFEKSYHIEICQDGKQIALRNFVQTDAVDGKVSCLLDELEALKEIEGEISLNVYVSSTDNYYDGTKTIEVFNSNKSSEIVITKIANPSSLQISDSILTFDAIDNAVDYEIYYLDGSDCTLLGSVSTNEYKFENVVSNSYQICVKAISKEIGFTNSSYSEMISVTKLAQPQVSIVDGKFHLDVTNLYALFTAGSVTIEPVINNNQKQDKITINVNDFNEGVKLLLTLTKSLDSMKIEMNDLNFTANEQLIAAMFLGYEINKIELVAEPYLFMEYNSESLSAEKLSVYYKISCDSEPYYLNSDSTTLDVYGLFAPTKVGKTTNTENTSIEQITWIPSDKNFVYEESLEENLSLNVNYIVKIVHTVNEETETYYFDAGTSESIDFPEGIADEGLFEVSVQAILKDTYNSMLICGSKYSPVCSFEILNKVMIKVDEGEISWEGNPQAKGYNVTVCKYDGTEEKTKYVEKTTFNLASDLTITGDGVYSVRVQAIGANSNVLNSKDSDLMYVYKLPEAISLEIDDGKLVLKSTPFFNFAKFEFVDETTNKIYEITYDNTANATDYLNALGISSSWMDLKDETNNFAELNSLFNTTITTMVEETNVFSGRNYNKIHVTLIGNTHDSKGIVSSSTVLNISDLTAKKLKPMVSEVELGVLQFASEEVYATGTTEFKLKDGIKFNYLFNNEVPASATDFWNNTIVYKVKLIHTTKDEELKDVTTETFIYAVDYYSFVSAINNGWLIENSDYELNTLTGNKNTHYATVYYNDLIFNVYLNNEINLKDFNYLTYYPLSENISEAEIEVSETKFKTFTSRFENGNEIQHINLTLGGSFTFELFTVGGDSYTESGNVGYLTSGANSIKTFVRYSEQKSLTSAQGMLKFVNLRPLDDDGNVIDSPIYKIVTTVFNDTSVSNVFYAYYDDENNPENALAIALGIAKRNAGVDVAEDKMIKVIVDGDFLYVDISQYLESATNYNISIQTLAGNGSSDEDSNYLLNAVESQAELFFKFSDSTITTESGNLKFAQSYIQKDLQVREYAKEYEITIESAGQIFVYNINSLSEGVKFVNTNIIYSLPNKITSENGDELTIQEGVDYTIKIRAKTSEADKINGSYFKVDNSDYVCAFTRAEGISTEENEGLRIENGLLKWNMVAGQETSNAYIRIYYYDSNSEIVYFEDVESSSRAIDENSEYEYSYYELKDTAYDLITGGSEVISNAQPYYVCVYVKGAGTTINSNISNVIQINRLAQVSNNIRTENGILHWDAIDDAVSYNISIEGSNQNFTIKNIEGDSFDLSSNSEFATLIGAEKLFSVKIKANGETKLNGLTSSAIEDFIQMNIVNVDSIKIDNGKVVWDSVSSADGYEVDFFYTNSKGEEKSILDYICSSSAFDPSDVVTDGIQGTFKLEIYSIGSGKLLKSSKVEFNASTEIPQQVKFVEIDEQFRIKITLNQELSSIDSLKIIFDMATYNSQTSLGEFAGQDPIIIKNQEKGYFNADDGCYYYPLSVMAKYKNISVTVQRQGTFDSPAVSIYNEEGDEFDLHVFAFGAGTFDNPHTTENEYNPYRISSESQLLNIKYFPSANYILVSTITLTCDNVVTTSQGALISDEFSGTINGNGLIINFNKGITLQDTTKFALFGTLNNATIKNLKFGELKLSNSFANKISDVIQLSLIATGANSSIIQDVSVENFTIELTGTIEPSATLETKQIYLAGLISQMNNTTIEKVESKFTANITAKINSTITSYVGGVSALSTNSTIVNNSTETEKTFSFEITTSANMAYVGGLIAKSSLDIIENVIVDFNSENNNNVVKAKYVGGLVAYAANATIIGCKTTGTYLLSILQEMYVGGLVGHLDNSTITDSGSSISFEGITISSLANKCFGKIVGYASNGSKIENCYSDNYDASNGLTETGIDNDIIIVRIYGKNDSSTITGCYNKN